MKTYRENEAENPKEHCFLMREVGQLGEAVEHSPKPTNWRSTTMRRSRTELRLRRGDQLRTVHGRETSGIEAKMARPLGPSQKVPQRVREQGRTPTRIAQTPECDEASKRSGTTGSSQAPRSKKPRRPDRRS